MTRHPTLPLRRERAEHANALIKVIAAHGRRFFYNAKNDRVSHFEIDDRSRVWYVDDYTGKRIYTHRTGFRANWHGFSHGGTLRALVEDMADYITTGVPVRRWVIGPSYSAPKSEYDNIWGYSDDAMKITREQAFALPIIESEKSEESA